MNKEQRLILQILEEYLTLHPYVRFGQALFETGINEFFDKANPEKADLILRDIHADSDAHILDRMVQALARENSAVENDTVRNVQPGMMRLHFLSYDGTADGNMNIKLKYRDIPEYMYNDCLSYLKGIYYLTDEVVDKFVKENIISL
jgi:hypothetical protein